MYSMWRDRLKVIAEEQLDWLLQHRTTFYQIVESAGRRPDAGDCSDLIDLVRDGYIAFAGTTIRKMADDKQTQSISLGMLLNNLKASHGLLTRKKYLEAFPDCPTAERTFDKIAGQAGAKCIPVSMIDADLERIRVDCKAAKDFADMVVAHTDKGRDKAATHYGEINQAIDTLRDLYKKYHSLLIGSEYAEPPHEPEELAGALARLWDQ